MYSTLRRSQIHRIFFDVCIMSSVLYSCMEKSIFLGRNEKGRNLGFTFKCIIVRLLQIKTQAARLMNTLHSLQRGLYLALRRQLPVLLITANQGIPSDIKNSLIANKDKFKEETSVSFHYICLILY